MDQEYYVKDGEEYKPLSDDHLVLSQSDLGKSYFTKEQRDSAVESAIQKRFSNHVNLDEAHENETIVARVLEKHGSGKSDIDEDALRKQIFDAHVTPAKKQAETAQERAARLEADVKRSKMQELLTSKDVGFDPRIFKRPEPGKPSPAEIYFGDKFGLDDDVSLIAEGTQTPALDVAKELASPDGPWAEFLAPDKKNATNAGRPGQDEGGAAPKTKTPRVRDMTEDQQREYGKKYGWAQRKVEGMPAFSELKH